VSAMMKTVMASMKKKYGSNENREKCQVWFKDDDNNNSDNDSECIAPYTGCIYLIIYEVWKHQHKSAKKLLIIVLKLSLKSSIWTTK
jgi:hypothetical protein